MQPELEDVIMTSALNHLITGVVFYVVQFVCHEQILCGHLVAANQQSLQYKDIKNIAKRGEKPSSLLLFTSSRLFFFQFILWSLHNERFEARSRKFLIDRRDKKQTRRDGSRSIWEFNSCAGRGKLRDIEFTKWRLVLRHPTSHHCTPMILRFYASRILKANWKLAVKYPPLVIRS